MAQKRLFSWTDPRETFLLNTKDIALNKAGIHHGFKFDRTDELLLHINQDNGIDIQDSGGVITKVGVLLTKQGTVILQDTEIELLIDTNVGQSEPRYDAVICEHNYDNVVGGSQAVYSVIKGVNSATPEKPTLVNEATQIVLGYLYIPAEVNDLATEGVVYQPVRAEKKSKGNQKIIAAYNSPYNSILTADYICKGHNDQLVILQAIENVKKDTSGTGRGSIKLLEGDFIFGDTLLLENLEDIDIEGSGKNTVLKVSVGSGKNTVLKVSVGYSINILNSSNLSVFDLDIADTQRGINIENSEFIKVGRLNFINVLYIFINLLNSNNTTISYINGVLDFVGAFQNIDANTFNFLSIQNCNLGNRGNTPSVTLENGENVKINNNTLISSLTDTLYLKFITDSIISDNNISDRIKLTTGCSNNKLGQNISKVNPDDIYSADDEILNNNYFINYYKDSWHYYGAIGEPQFSGSLDATNSNLKFRRDEHGNVEMMGYIKFVSLPTQNLDFVGVFQHVPEKYRPTEKSLVGHWRSTSRDYGPMLMQADGLLIIGKLVGQNFYINVKYSI